MTASSETLLAKLRGLLAPGEPTDWHEHDGEGRPHKGSDFVEAVRRDGSTVLTDSAFIRWPWADDDEDDRDGDVTRWRFAKRPPSDRELAGHVPSLLDTIDQQVIHIEALEARVREFKAAGQAMLPTNVSLDNLRWPDSTVVPLDTTLGELRALRRLLTKDTPA